jgi:putative copper export protein/methionine-rich copper-binding protein CopC
MRYQPLPFRGRARALLGGAVVLTCLFGFTSTAWAHALQLRADPAQDALLHSSPHIIHLWFSEDLNLDASKIVVWDRYRHVMNVGQAKGVPGQPRQLEVPVRPLKAGTYLVLWTSVSAQDGHILHGFYLFSVKKRGPGPSLTGVSGGSGQGFPDTPTLVALVSHWIELVGAVAWVGAALFSGVVLPRAEIDGPALADEARRTRRVMASFLAALLAASTVVIAMQAYGIAGNSLGSILSASTLAALFQVQYGQLWLLRQGLVIVALVALLRPAIRSLTVAREQAAIGVVYLYAFAASGHAASADVAALPQTSIVSGGVFLDWLHYLADAAWFGGQIYIVLVLIQVLRLRREPNRTGAFLHTLDRFSPVAYASIALYMVSGVFSAKVHIPSWFAFFNSPYGRALIVKVVLIGLMMLVSAFTVYLVRPRLRIATLLENQVDTRISASLMARLLNWLQVNPVLGLGVLLATSVMFYYPVPPGFAPAGPSAYTAHRSGLTAVLRITPDRSGPNTISVALTDRHGKPVTQAQVTVLTTMLDMVMGTGLASLHEKGPGQFSGTTDLGMGGRWRLGILVYQPSGLTRMSVKVQVGT